MHNGDLPFCISHSTKKRHIGVFVQYWNTELLQSLVLAVASASSFVIFSAITLLYKVWDSNHSCKISLKQPTDGIRFVRAKQRKDTDTVEEK